MSDNIAKKLRESLLNYDLSIQYAISQLKFYELKMKELAGEESKAKQKKFLLAKLKYQKYELYYKELVSAKREILKRIELVIGTYNSNDVNIFMDYFIFNVSFNDIMKKYKLTNDYLFNVIVRLQNQLIKL